MVKIYKYIKSPDHAHDSEDVLESDYRQLDQIAAKIVVRDSTKNHFIVFDDIGDMCETLSAFDPADRTFHEVIFGLLPQKLRFDVDIADFEKIIISKEFIPDDELERYIMEDLIDPFTRTAEYVRIIIDKAIRDSFLLNYGIDLADNDVVVCTSSRKPKVSYHFIVDHYQVANGETAREFANRTAQYLPADICSGLDLGVYKTLQNFRLLGSQKDGREKILLGAETGNFPTIDDLKRTMISWTAECAPLVNLVGVTKNANVNGIGAELNVSADQFERIMEICRENGILEYSRYRMMRHGMIIFDRTRPSFCDFCNRNHDHDNTVLVKLDDGSDPTNNIPPSGIVRIFRQCRKDPAKQRALIGEYLADVDPAGANVVQEAQNAQVRQQMGWSERNIARIVADQAEGKLPSLAHSAFNRLPAAQKILYSEPQMRPFQLAHTLCVRAGMKLGKTKALVDYINNYFNSPLEPPTIRIISFRQTFSGNLREKFPDFTMYSDVKSPHIMDRKVIIQVESLHRLAISEGQPAPDLVVLDECESIFEQFSSGLARYARSGWAVFQWLLRRAKHVIAMDANLGDRTYRMLERMRIGEETQNFTLHCNEFQNGVDDKYWLTADKFRWLGALYKYIRDEKRIAVPISSLTEAKILEADIRAKFATKRVKIYSSETSQGERKDHFANVNLFWAEYDILIYTPTVSAGVSFEARHFDVVFAYFTDQSCPVETCFQMLGRIRNVGECKYYVCLSATPDRLPTEPAEIIRYFHNEREILMRDLDDNLLTFEYGPNGRMIYHQSDYFHLWVENIRMRNLSRNSFVRRFVQIVAEPGATISHFDEAQFRTITGQELHVDGELNPDVATIKEDHKLARANIKVGAAAAIANSRELTEDEANDITDARQAQREITPEQALAYEKYRLRRDYHYQADPANDAQNQITAQFVEKYAARGPRLVFRNLCRIAGPKEIGPTLARIQAEERASYLDAMADDRKQQMDVTYRYTFDQHRLSLGFLQTCGWTWIGDTRQIHVANLHERIRQVEASILDNLGQICNKFAIKRPNVPSIIGNRQCPAQYVMLFLKFFNKILGQTYDVAVRQTDDKEMYQLKGPNLFRLGPTGIPTPYV